MVLFSSEGINVRNSWDGWSQQSFADMIDDFEEPTERSVEPEEEELGLLRLWWVAKGHEDAALITEKYKEYGNTALLEVGQQLADVMGREDITKAEAQELGIWFFMMGKMARLKSAILRGDQASEDTWQDLTCYSMMGRRIRSEGGWPGGN